MPIDAVKGVYDLVKRAQDIAEDLKNIELQNIILNLRKEILSYKEEILSLKEEVISLQENSKNNTAIEWNGTIYFFKSEGPEKGGLCPRCKDADNKTVRLTYMHSNAYGPPLWHCHNCKTSHYKN